MRILLLVESFNSLSQRVYAELARDGHELTVEFAVHDVTTHEGVALFSPDVIVAPYLKRAIPRSLWSRYPCLIVHPGIPGDRGPSALDWAIGEEQAQWGVTILQANETLDGGDIWAFETFPMRVAPKSSLYRHEVTEAAVKALRRALALYAGKTRQPLPQGRLASCPDIPRGRAHPPMTQADRAIDWQADPTAAVVKKIHAADGAPGVRDRIGGKTVYLYGAWPEGVLRGAPGALIAQRDGAVCRATVDGAVWITHMQAVDADGRGLKLPAVAVLGTAAADLPCPPVVAEKAATWQEITCERDGAVCHLHFRFYNGAMSADQCRRLADAYRALRETDARVIVLHGGADYWSNGIHLHVIEAAASPADESWRNIEAMDDLVLEILANDRQLTIAALSGNAAAGGVFLALAADAVYARQGVILNPHYKNMGNLYGSEYWTYLLPRRLNADESQWLRAGRLPLDAAAATAIGLIDGAFGRTPEAFTDAIARLARAWAHPQTWSAHMARKVAERARDEARRPLALYRAEELEQMRRNFYGFDRSYHVARHHFVHKTPHSRTPLYLAAHRRMRAKNAAQGLRS
ncbi:MAG: hydrogenase maturation protein [Gammaproteobacteria bacterium]|nr:hydrogenase maturation protein [Gammaproteobacteria bacterium]